MTRIQYGVPEMLHDDLSLSEARCVALAAQGFDRPRPRGPISVQHLRRTIRQLGLVQIDYVNVLVAHTARFRFRARAQPHRSCKPTFAIRSGGLVPRFPIVWF